MGNNTGVIEIFLYTLLGSLFCIGGGSGPVTIIQNAWVSDGRLDASLFSWVLALSYLTPGPKVGFISGVGYYLHGFSGAAASLAGVILPSVAGAALVERGMTRMKPLISRVSKVAGFILAGMIAATAWDTAIPMHFTGIEYVGAAFVAWIVAWKKVSALWIILGSMSIGILIWWLQ
jgi:chromate transporter